MADVNWLLEYFAVEDSGAAVWKPVASGDYRLRAVGAFLVAAAARPDRTLMLWWQ